MNNKQFKKWLIRHKACPEAIQWVGKRNLKDAYKDCHKKEWILWASQLLHKNGLLNRKHLDVCAKAKPVTALKYAASLLSPKRLDACAKKWPWQALEYAAKFLSPECLDACAKPRPLLALRYAAEFLSPERLDACIKENPWATLEYGIKKFGISQIIRIREIKND